MQMMMMMMMTIQVSVLLNHSALKFLIQGYLSSFFFFKYLQKYISLAFCYNFNETSLIKRFLF